MSPVRILRRDDDADVQIGIVLAGGSDLGQQRLDRLLAAANVLLLDTDAALRRAQEAFTLSWKFSGVITGVIGTGADGVRSGWRTAFGAAGGAASKKNSLAGAAATAASRPRRGVRRLPLREPHVAGHQVGEESRELRRTHGQAHVAIPG